MMKTMIPTDPYQMMILARPLLVVRNLPSKKSSPIPSISGYSCKMIDSRQPSKTSHEDLETVPMKKVKLTPDMSGATEMGTTRQTGERKKLPKPVSEMDSQELLDLL
uniref:Uncharacterized protein n=1 Tax=Cacopsylla melanoneura TaxID=428564 RepID=A0A8D9FHF9_9HEMI